LVTIGQIQLHEPEVCLVTRREKAVADEEEKERLLQEQTESLDLWASANRRQVTTISDSRRSSGASTESGSSISDPIDLLLGTEHEEYRDEDDEDSVSDGGKENAMHTNKKQRRLEYTSDAFLINIVNRLGKAASSASPKNEDLQKLLAQSVQAQVQQTQLMAQFISAQTPTASAAFSSSSEVTITPAAQHETVVVCEYCQRSTPFAQAFAVRGCPHCKKQWL
jgi:hypothetical protein